jgi:hypothetical protein
MSMMLQILVSALLFAWLAYAAISHRLTSKAKTSTYSCPPVHFSWIPFVGHILGIAAKGSNLYISSLWYLSLPLHHIIYLAYTKVSQFDPTLVDGNPETPWNGHALDSPAGLG